MAKQALAATIGYTQRNVKILYEVKRITNRG